MKPNVLEAIAPALVQLALSHSTARARTLVITLLENLEPAALDAHAPLLLSLLRDDFACVRSAAMNALRGLTMDGKRRHQAALLAMLDHTTGDVRADVVWALGCVLSPHELAQHSRLLVALAGDRDPCLRASALRAMSYLEPADLAPHAELIARALRSPSEHERCCALKALRALGPKSGASLPPWLKALLAADKYTQRELYGVFRISTQDQHGDTHWCQAAAGAERLVSDDTAGPFRKSKRRCRRWLLLL
jgi:HEAT repeat protein